MIKNIRSRKGFTLIELLVVVLIIGILAAIAVPQYFRVVEKGRAAEAVSFVQSIKGAEERQMMKTGNYVVASSLDVNTPAMTNFGASAISLNGATSWAIALTRNATVPTYGQYTVTYNSASGFTCSNQSCTNDLIP